MSGNPNPDGVKALKQSLRALKGTQGKMAVIEQTILEQEKQLDKYEQDLRDHREAIKAAMMEMDVANPANLGYERRRLELLLMLAEL